MTGLYEMQKLYFTREMKVLILDDQLYSSISAEKPFKTISV